MVAPLVVLLVGLALIGAYDDPREADKRTRAGAVVNGKTLVPQIGTVARYIELRMRRRPRVVIFGNSLANTDIQTGSLARDLGLRASDVELFSIPNSNGSHWYAMLKNRVFASGHRPDLVIVLADLRSVLSVKPASQTSLLDLRQHLTDDDETLRGLLGEEDSRYTTLLTNRSHLRERLLSSARNLSVDLLYHRRAPRPEVSHADTVYALGRALDASRVDVGLHAAVLGRMLGNGVDGIGSVEPPPPVELSALPLLSALAAKHGAMLAVVRPPFAANVPDYLADEVPAVEKQKARDLLTRAGHRLIDLRGVHMGRGHFTDAVHMNDEGSRRFTRVVSRLLRQRGMLGASMPAGVPLVDPIDARTDDIGWRRPVISPSAPPPTLQATLGVPSSPTLEAGPRRMAAMIEPRLRNLSDPSTVIRTEYLARCSPVRVAEDGVLLPFPNATCTEVISHGRGRYCHMADRLILTASDATAPIVNGRSYTLALTSSRECDGGAWLYPGDSLRLAVDQTRFLGHPGPWDTLWVSAASVTRSFNATGMSVELVLPDGRRVGGPLPAVDLASGRAIMTFDPPVDQPPVEIVVSNPNPSFLLLLDLHLTTSDVTPPPRRGRNPEDVNTTPELDWDQETP